MSLQRKQPRQPGSDDLTQISGIGETRQQWLYEKFGVNTFHDLAGLSAEAIIASLKEEGQIVSAGRVKGWIDQARQLSSSTPHPKDEEWKPFASFVVEFQQRETKPGLVERRTRVHYMEADRTTMWPEIEHRELCAWMVSQLGEKGQSPKPSDESAVTREIPDSQERFERLLRKVERESEAAAHPAAGSASRFERLLARVQQQPASEVVPEARPVPAPTAVNSVLRVVQFNAYQPPESTTRSPVIMSGKPFALRLSFNVSPADKQPTTYHVQFYAQPGGSRPPILLGEIEPTGMTQTGLQTQVFTVSTLAVGTYRLQAVIRLTGGLPAIAYGEIPFFQVI